MLTLNVPPGIGDISWLYSKLKHMDRPYTFNICDQAALNRSLGFVDILPGVTNGGYCKFNYHECFIKKQLGLPPDTDPRTLPDGEYYLSANTWVDNGNRLDKFMPMLPTDYHFPLNIPLATVVKMRAMFNKLPKPVIGIYTSKYLPKESGWQFWLPVQWAGLCKQLQDRLGLCSFVFLGAKFDLGVGIQAAEMVNKFAPCLDLIGETNVAEAVQAIKTFDYFFAFPSGLGIMGDVVDTPTMMFLPSPRHDGLKDMYADPETIKSGRHLNVMYPIAVEDALKVWDEKGRKQMEVPRWIP